MVSKIFHVSDIHFRLYKRHNEYEIVLNRLFECIDREKDENSIILIAGDVVHSKTDMSPELISVVSNFFKNCADRLPTILIIGNHDFNMRSSNRMDALTPIVESISHPNFHYWKSAGVRRFMGVAFSVFSIADKQDAWVLAPDISDDYKIALYHGPVHGCVNDQGYPIGGYGIPIDFFDGFDLGLCGDIHTCQFMNRSKTVGYSGSLIGQSFAEHSTRHGILIWNVAERSSKFVSIPNDYSYVTVELVNGAGRLPEGLPKNIRLRIKYSECTPLQIDQFVDRVSKRYNIIELIKIKVNNNNIASISDERIFGNSRDISYQNDIIVEYLKSTDAMMTDVEIDKVCRLNAVTNQSMNSKPVLRNVIWRIKRLEFSNMFSYGEDNTFDFELLDGLYGIFSPNAQGKSSAFNILCFALYDKVPTATKASHILNIHKDEFRCKVQFEVDGIDYFIERVGTKKPNGAVRVDVDFWYYDELGNKVLLNGEDRDKTNYVIREYIGQYDDFLMTALSTQYDNQSFVEKSQRERKELLYKFLDISIYDDLFKIAKERAKEFQILIRQYESGDLRQICDQLAAEIGKLESDAVQLNAEHDKVNTIKKEKTAELVQLNKEYVQIDVEMDRDLIDQVVTKLRQQMEQTKQDIQSINDQKRELRKTIRMSEKSLIPVQGELAPIESQCETYKAEIDRISKELFTLDSEISHCEMKQDRLAAHEYDPNCRFCVNNEFVKDARSAIALLPELKGKRFRLQIELAHYSGEYDVMQLEITKLVEYQESVKKIRQMESDAALLDERLANSKYKLESINEQLKHQNLKLSEWQKNRTQIEKNVEIQRSIQKTNEELAIIEKKESRVQDQIKYRYAQIEKTKKEYSDNIQKLNTYIDYLEQYRIYELYLKSISKEGVPYKILQTVLPVIEHEVNAILSQIADFTVRLDTEDEKNVNAYIVYDEFRSWPVELTSGMERFILSLAFRQALTEITSLPRPNFMAIDEGFGVLDSENLQAVGRLFSYLKSRYDYLLIISHIDAMRDMVDKQIRIDKIDGFSKIYA